MRRYSSRQLIVAKCAVVVLAAFIAGPQLADKPSELAVSILVVFAILGLAVAAYEAFSHALALLLGRLWGRDTASDELSAADSTPVAPSPRSSSRMRLRHIIAAFVGYLASQALVWLGAALVVTMRLGTEADEQAITRGLKPLLPAVLPASVVAGGLGVLWALRSWGQRLDPRGLVETVALRRGTHQQLLRGMLAGATLGFVALVLMPYVPYSPSSPDLIDEFLTSPGPARWSWILTAVILAPPVEELVFRGVLLGGLARIWSLRAAAFVSGVTFWAMHAPEWLRYWPAAVAIALMTMIVTALRLRTRALGPPIAAHSVYNLLMASAAFGIQTDGGPVRGTDGPKWAQLAPGTASRPGDTEGRLKLGMDLGFKGKRALVTGSTAGIGLGAARALAAEGAQVTVNGRTASLVAQAVEQLQQELPDAKIQGIPTDLSAAAGCSDLVRQLPAVDILVNNLGIFEPKPFEEINDADWFRFFETNVLSGVRLSRHYIPGMRVRDWGRWCSSPASRQFRSRPR